MRHDPAHDRCAHAARPGPNLRLSVQISDPLEHWYLTRILETAARMGRLPVRFGASPATADVLIAVPGEGAGQAPGGAPADASGPVLVAYAPTRRTGQEWLPRPARTRDARQLLERLWEDRHVAARARPTGAAVSALPFAIAGGELLLPQLRRLLATGQDALLQTARGISLLVLPRLRSICSPVDADLADYCQALRTLRLPDIRVLGEAEAARHRVETHRHSVSLEAVCWELCLEALPVAASPALLEGRRLSLRAWPDFRALPHRAEFLRWAALLTREAVPLHALVQYSPDGMEPVARFLNACHMLGLLEISAS